MEYHELLINSYHRVVAPGEANTLELEIIAKDGKKIAVESGEMQMVPKTTVKLDVKGATQALKLLDKLEELDDTQNVYSNADIPDEVMEAVQAAQ